MHRERDYGRQGQRQIKLGDLPIGQDLAARFESSNAVGNAERHEPRRHRLEDDTRGERRRAHERAWKPKIFVEHNGRRRHGDDPHPGAIGDAPRHLVADEKTLVKAPIANSRRPWKQEHQRLMRQDQNLGWKGEDVDREPVEYRLPNHDEHEKSDQKIECIAEVPQLSERVPILD